MSVAIGHMRAVRHACQAAQIMCCERARWNTGARFSVVRRCPVQYCRRWECVSVECDGDGRSWTAAVSVATGCMRAVRHAFQTAQSCEKRAQWNTGVRFFRCKKIPRTRWAVEVYTCSAMEMAGPHEGTGVSSAAAYMRAGVDCCVCCKRIYMYMRAVGNAFQTAQSCVKEVRY